VHLLLFAKDLAYTTSNDGNTANTQNWGGVVTTPLVDIPIVMGTTSDSFGCTSFLGGSMAGKIAVIWRGPIGSAACEFGTKALNAQNAGAIACVLINEYPGEGPVGMAAGSQGVSVTIPVFMIGNLEGMALAGAYRNLAPSTVKMTITPWGRNNANDLGFVPGGVATWHDGAIPAYQLQAAAAASTYPTAYKGINGAFIANYGTGTQSNVKLKSVLSFTPTGGSPAVVKSDSVTLANFPALDSIYTMFAPEYNLPTVSGTGRYDLNYNISATAADQFISDNSYTHSFYATDSIFCKGRYDYTNHHPVATLWTGANALQYLWGVPYYVEKGGAAIKDIQFSASNGPGPIANTYVLCYVFKWNDNGNKVIETSELALKGVGGHAFLGTDSSFQFFTTEFVTQDTTGQGNGFKVVLEDKSTYLICAEPSLGSANMALGCDGIVTQYPRAYGRAHFNNTFDYYNNVFAGAKTDFTGAESFASYAFGGNVFNVDSVVYNTQYGLVPALAMRTMPYTGVNVKNTTPIATKFELYPNPSTDHVTVSIDLVKQAKNVSYTVVNTMAQVVGRESKSDVSSDTYNFDTKNLPAGTYYMVVVVDGKSMFKQFTVLKK
jgi:hypothetical protein